MAGIGQACIECRWMSREIACSHRESPMRGTNVAPLDVCDHWEALESIGESASDSKILESGKDMNIPTKRRGSVLLEAEKTINGKRQDCYGSPEDSFKVIAELWTTWLRNVLCRELTAHDVAMMMSLFKHARLMHGADRDGYRDACGYIALACDMAGAEDVEKDR